VRARVSEAETARLASERRVTGARSALTAARRRHDDAVRQAERSRRAEAARAVLADLAASADEAARADAALDAHERAQRCAPVVNALDRAQAACVDAPDVDALLADLLAPLGGDAAMVAADGPPLARASSALSTVDRAVGEARDRITRLEALLPRERGAVTVQQELAVARSSLDSAQHHERRLSSRAAHLPPEIARCATALEAASVRAGRVEALRVQLAAARERRDAAAERDQLRVELVAAEDARRDARERLLDARDRVQALAARRLAGMAGELAAALVDGAPCQVCGSKEHPAPAGRAADAVTEQEQQHAEAVLAQQQACFDDADAGCARTRERFGALEAAAGGASIDQATSAARDLATRLSEAERAAVEQQVHDRELGALRDEQAAVARELAGLSAEVRRLQESVTAREAVLAEVRHEVAAALAAATTRGSAAVGVDAADETPVSAAVSVERDLLQRLVEGRRALQRCEEAASLAETLAAEASLTALDHGFDGLDQVRRCLLSGPETERLRELLATRAAAQAHARSVLEELGTSDAQPAAETDLARLDGALAAAEQEATVAAGELAVRSESVTALRAHLDDLCEVLDEWAPVRDEALRAESMSRLVRGLGHENRLQMRLSAYVLATRLDQVVAAANERLASMRDQRYLLQRTGRAERKGSRAGLGLEVVDQWTGEVRAPTTLSGGETFVVSLALALGLADVVTHESGGTDVQTLFVDEGFGSLDAETLDDVMDRLDALRSGGRTVGVVSHVAELRGRIATRVEVLKGRSGSTVALRTLAG
jgi:exonuclease SbcC